jgi:hypothetical protein
LGLRPYTANREADVPFCRAHGIHWGVSKRGKVRNVIPLGWHDVQRSDIPGGRRRGSKQSYKSSVRAAVFESFSIANPKHVLAAFLTRLRIRISDSGLGSSFTIHANTWPSSKYAPQ